MNMPEMAIGGCRGELLTLSWEYIMVGLKPASHCTILPTIVYDVP